MGGKRRDYDGSFAMIDINFVIDDPRLDGLSAADRWVYITLWCLAVRERSSVLVHYKFVSSLARLSRVRPTTCVKSLNALEQNCLISRDDDGVITVIGVRDKHKNLKWKECGINEDMHLNKNANATHKKKKKNKKKKEEGKELVLDFPLPPKLDTNQFRKSWKLWEQHKSEINKPITPLSVKFLLEKLSVLGEKKSIEIIDTAIANGWTGLVFDNGKSKPKIYEEELPYA